MQTLGAVQVHLAVSTVGRDVDLNRISLGVAVDSGVDQVPKGVVGDLEMQVLVRCAVRTVDAYASEGTEESNVVVVFGKGVEGDIVGNCTADQPSDQGRQQAWRRCVVPVPM